MQIWLILPRISQIIHGKTPLKFQGLVCFWFFPPVNYLMVILVTETNKVLESSVDLQEFIRWVGCWIYTACWVGFPNHWYWRYTADPSMCKGAPFRLHLIMSHNRFDDILSDIWYTNKEVPCVVIFLATRLCSVTKLLGGVVLTSFRYCSNPRLRR